MPPSLSSPNTRTFEPGQLAELGARVTQPLEDHHPRQAPDERVGGAATHALEPAERGDDALAG